MICEPNTNLPQHIDLESIRKSSQETPKNDNNKALDEEPKVKITYEIDEYNVLPLFKDQFQHLDEILSLQSNKYLTCRWNTFLDKVPKNYIRIRSYMDYMKTLEIGKVRRMCLNGQFYGVDNNLAPIPQMDDPRNYFKKSVIKKQNPLQNSTQKVLSL